ncbi:MAG TPA: response regulator transcription factor [Campylobacteraceae bacterium]|nr:response regulator transcription factor [Campylobacteraceae bacterium]
MKSAHIVIIEDEEDILELEEYHLQKAGYEVTGFLSTRRVDKLLEEEEVDLLIVDRNLPGTEGSEFVAQLRDAGYQIPVIFVSAKDRDTEVEEGFLRGGDDYLTKPFNMNELILRVRSVLRRTMGSAEGRVVYRDLTLELDERKVFIDNSEIKLSKLEFELLLYFVKHKHTALTRDQLLEAVWGDDAFKQEKTVNVTINRLLKKIDPARNKRYIEPVRGVGYKLC